MKTLGIIPARYASKRFPGKPLALIDGKPIIQHVYEHASGLLDHTVVATDDSRIYMAVQQFGGNVVKTSNTHCNGTDRCYEALLKIGADDYDLVLNIQGDEPFIKPDQIQIILSLMEDPKVRIATLAKPFNPTAPFSSLENINAPKVVLTNDNNALYFSRSIIPYLRGKEHDEWLPNHTYYRHIGIYAYRPDTLSLIAKLPQSSLEKAESLEQLRWLEYGISIKVGLTDNESVSIDTPEDIEKAEQLIKTI